MRKQVLVAGLIVLILLSGCIGPNPLIDDGNTGTGGGTGNGGNGNGGGVTVVPVVKNDVYKIEGDACPELEEVEGNYALPEGCSFSEVGEQYWFTELDVKCDGNTLIEQGCSYLDDEGVTKGGGKLVKTDLSNKTLIECQRELLDIGYDDVVRVYDFHPGPQIGSFYLTYDDSTKEIEKLVTVEGVFEALAPIDSEEKVWAGLRLSSPDGLYCSFESEGFAPYLPEGQQYEEDVWELELFGIPKEQIKVSSVEAVEGGFKAHILGEAQGCPCFIDYYQYDLVVKEDGSLVPSEGDWVYAAELGCIC